VDKEDTEPDAVKRESKKKSWFQRKCEKQTYPYAENTHTSKAPCQFSLNGDSGIRPCTLYCKRHSYEVLNVFSFWPSAPQQSEESLEGPQTKGPHFSVLHSWKLYLEENPVPLTIHSPSKKRQSDAGILISSTRATSARHRNQS